MASGEGIGRWDGTQATMTNASVETAVAGVDGQVLTLKYKDGEKKLLVTPKTAIVACARRSRRAQARHQDLHRSGAEAADGSLQATRISAATGSPPM